MIFWLFGGVAGVNNGEGGMKIDAGLLGGNAWFESGDISGAGVWDSF